MTGRVDGTGVSPDRAPQAAAGQAAHELLEFETAVERLSTAGGVVLLVGATDTGKSTLALQIANAAVRLGRKVAIVDGDLGQGEIGPPGTVGLVTVEAPVASLAELRPRTLAFVGDSHPHGHLLTLLQAMGRLLQRARHREHDLILLDTCGASRGRIAERLVLAQATLLEPGQVVLLHEGRELERLAVLLDGATAAELLHVRRAPAARRKSPVYRRVQRANRMRRHLALARAHTLDAGQVRVVDAWFFTGHALPAATLRAARDALGVPVPYGERTADGTFLCVEGTPSRGGFARLPEILGRQRVTLTAASVLEGLLLGLVGPGGHLQEIGLLQGIDFERAEINIWTPARSLGEIRQVHFGRIRLKGDGTEVGRLGPADL